MYYCHKYFFFGYNIPLVENPIDLVNYFFEDDDFEKNCSSNVKECFIKIPDGLLKDLLFCEIRKLPKAMSPSSNWNGSYILTEPVYVGSITSIDVNSNFLSVAGEDLLGVLDMSDESSHAETNQEQHLQYTSTAIN